MFRILHKARLLSDAVHAINKAAKEAEGMTEEAKKQKLITAAPAYLASHVEGEEELPSVDINSRLRNDKQDMMAWNL